MEKPKHVSANKPSQGVGGGRNIFAPKWDNLISKEKRENHRTSHNSKSSSGKEGDVGSSSKKITKKKSRKVVDQL